MVLVAAILCACGTGQPSQLPADHTSSSAARDTAEARRKETAVTKNKGSAETFSDTELDSTGVGPGNGDATSTTGHSASEASNTPDSDQQERATPAPTPPAPTSEPTINPAADCYSGDDFSCRAEREITRLTNLKRAGLPPLQHDAKLSFVARDWSRQQGLSGLISHTGFPLARISVYRQEFASQPSILGENVAMFSGSGSISPENVAQTFVEQWFNSDGHRRNMLGNYGSLGAGVHKSAFGYYGTQLFGD